MSAPLLQGLPPDVFPGTERIGEELAGKQKLYFGTDPKTEVLLDFARLRLVAQGADVSAAALEYLESRVLLWAAGYPKYDRKPGDPVRGAQLGSEWLPLPLDIPDPLQMLQNRQEAVGLQPSSPYLRSIPRPAAEVLFQCMGAVQLNNGCSLFCPFCTYDAERGVRTPFDTSDLRWLAHHFAAKYFQRNQIILWWASDPLDWFGTLEFSGERVGYPYAHHLFGEHGRCSPGVSTAVPVGKEQQVLDCLPIIGRVSLSEHNRTRLTRAWGEQLPSLIGRGKVQPIVPEFEFGRTPAFDQERRQFGIPFIEGVVMTPTGSSNKVVFYTSEKYPKGYVSVPIDHTMFNDPLPVDRQELAQPEALQSVLSRGAVSYRYYGSRFRRTMRLQRIRPGNFTTITVTNNVSSQAYVVDGDNGTIALAAR